MSYRNKVALISVVLISLIILSSCGQQAGSEFGVYLADTGELVISERDIRSFDGEQMVLELNENGIKRWNAFAPDGIVPKLADSLHSRDFIMKIGGQELCRGKFWSLVSSQMHFGIIIADPLFTLSEEFNRLFIQFGCPASMAEDPEALSIISAELTHILK